MSIFDVCPRCGAVVSTGGCLSCGWPNGTLRERTAADTALAEKSKSDAPLGYVRYELLAEANVLIRDLSAAIQKWQIERNVREGEDAALRKLADLAVGLACEFECAIAASKPVGGMQVTPNGDFIACVQLPSALKRMEWWAREIRKAQRSAFPEEQEPQP